MLSHICTLLILVSAVSSERLWRSRVTKKNVKGTLSAKVTPKKSSEALCDSTVEQKSGYFGVSTDGAHDANYFFWQFDSRNDPSNDPFIIWMTGGPGCSSQLALLSENGPCKPTSDGLNTINNEFSWTSNANVLWIDQPADVGYSYGNMPVDLLHNEEEVADHMYNFIQAFMKEYPQYQKNDFYVFGESYGGHFVPAVSNYVYEQNKNIADGNVKVNIQGVGIGNGLTKPTVQYQYYAEMANNNTYGIKCVSDDTYTKMVDSIPRCVKLAEKCQVDTDSCVTANDYCNLKQTNPYYATGLNPYDIRKECGDNSLCYDFSNVDTFLNLNSTRTALGISDKAPETWQSCNNKVNAGFGADWMVDFDDKLVPMLEDGLRVLIYAGDVDFICNWIGNKHWTLELEWSGKKDFNAANDQPWKLTNGTQAGNVRAANGLTFLQVFEAGHMVPMDQPESSLEMLQTYLSNKESA